MTPIKIGMVLTLILVMTLIGIVGKWAQAAIAWWLPALFIPVWIYIAHLIDKADARKATGSQLPGSRDRERG